MREASFKIPVRETVAMEEPIARPQPRKPVETASRQTTRKLTELTKPVEKKTVRAPVAKAPAKTVRAAETGPAAKGKKAGDKKVEASVKPVTKPVRLANVDPLAPLPAKANSKRTAKDSGSAR